MKEINVILEKLTKDEKQLLKDTIVYGLWGDTEEEFLNDKGEVETDSCYGYCTNDAVHGKHFSGRKISGLFSSMYKKLCPNGVGEIISNCNDWWGDNSGDMLFIRIDYVKAFENWAKEKDKKSSEKLA